jgi:hypothetical protein
MYVVKGLEVLYIMVAQSPEGIGDDMLRNLLVRAIVILSR